MCINQFIILILCFRKKKYYYCHLTCKKIWTYYLMYNYIDNKCSIIPIININFDEESMSKIIENNKDLFHLLYIFSDNNNISGINVFDKLFKENKICLDMARKAIITSAQCNDYKLIKLLIKYINPSIDNNNLIRIACRNNYYHIAKLLLDNSDVDPTVYYNYSIRVASKYGSYKIVEKLLEDPRVDHHALNNYAYRHAKKNNHHKVAELLSKS